MNHRAIGQIFFSASLVLSPDCVKSMLCLYPLGLQRPGTSSDAITPSHLVAILESLCAREMQAFVDQTSEVVVGSMVECKHRAPIPSGSVVRVDGWVIHVKGDRATFGVQASDDQEVVCEGQIRLAVVRRDQIERKIERKREAIQRRELFKNA